MAPRSSIRAADVMTWVPYSAFDLSAHAAFWKHIHGGNWDEAPAVVLDGWLRTVQGPALKIFHIDLRVLPLNALGVERDWQDFQVPQWVAGAAILSRAVMAANHLESIHIRMSPQAEQFALVEELVQKNCHLSDLTIDVDSAVMGPGSRQPTLNLTQFFDASQDRANFTRFIVRAPACPVAIPDGTALFGTLADAEVFRIVTSVLEVPTSPCAWAMEALGAAPDLLAFQLAVITSTNHPVDAREGLRSVTMPRLVDLTLDLPVINANLLRRFTAPELRKIRIRSARPLHWNEGGFLDHWHFPALSYLKIAGSGPIITRFQLVGAPRDAFVSLTPVDDERDDYEGDLTAYLKPAMYRTGTASPPGPLSQHSSLDVSPEHARESGDNHTDHATDAGTSLPEELDGADVSVYGEDGSVLIPLPGEDGTFADESTAGPSRLGGRSRGPRPGYFYKPSHGGVVYFGMRPVPSPLGGVCPGHRRKRK